MTWDCIVVGGGAAGLSAALVLGRARKRTLVIDAGRQSNRAAHGIGGLLGNDGRAPADFYAAGRAELQKYGVTVRDGDVVSGEPGFALTLADGTREEAARVLLATGMEYRYPDVPGIAERFGGSVFHCPFCHGWEVRGRPLGLLAGEDDHRFALLHAWSDDVTAVTDVVEVRDPDATVVFTDGSTRTFGGLLVPVALHQRSTLATQLGAELAEETPLTAEAIAVDAMYATSVTGLFAAGDATPMMPSVPNAIAAGATAAAMVVGSLI
jgi:thioredoxin reductase